MEQMRERVARAIITTNWPSLSGKDVDEMVEGYLFDADAALSLMQPEIDRRVAEERAALLNALRDAPDKGSPAMLVAGKNALYSCSEDPELEDARRCWQTMLAQFEKEQQP